MRNRKLLLLFLALAQLPLLSIGQQIKTTSKDSIVISFINSKEVIDGFKFCHKPDTGILIFLDPNKLLRKELIARWWGHPVEIITEGELIDSIKNFNPNYVIKNRNNYFIVKEVQSETGVRLYIHAPYTNLICYASIKKIKKKYYLGKIGSGVI